MSPLTKLFPSVIHRVGAFGLFAFLAFGLVLAASNPVWADTTVGSQDTNSQMTGDGMKPCPGTDGQQLAKDLRAGRESSYANEAATTVKTLKDIWKAQAANPLKEVKGDVGKKYCIDDIKIFFDSLRKLITKLEQFIIDMIVTLIQKILEKICEIVKSTITSLLEMVCIPLPDISLPDFNISGLSGKSCDGISLADFVEVTPGASFDISSKVPRDYFSKKLSRYIGEPKSISLFDTLGGK